MGKQILKAVDDFDNLLQVWKQLKLDSEKPEVRKRILDREFQRQCDDSLNAGRPPERDFVQEAILKKYGEIN